MLTFVSKLLGALLLVSNLLVLVGLAGAFALLFRWMRLGHTLVWTATLGFLLVGFGPIGSILMRPLEDRFPRPSDEMPEPTGIVVLGGIISGSTLTRGAIGLTQDGERLTEAAALARLHPGAKLVFAGISFGDQSASEPIFAKRFFVSLGVEEARIVLERRSQNTAENARFTRDLLMPQSGERWILVTSASHMPRAVGAFRRAGFPVIPYPVGYTTSGLSSDYWGIGFGVSTNLVRADVAFHEWLGLLAYWLAGSTADFLPGPESSG